MVGGMVMGYMAGLHYWWPKITGRMYSDWWSRLAAMILFIGFFLTFLPQFVAGYNGMPRRYHMYAPEFQVWNVMSTAGASILGVGYMLPLFYLIPSLWYGKPAGRNPWHATGLEWQTAVAAADRKLRDRRRSSSVRLTNTIWKRPKMNPENALADRRGTPVAGTHRVRCAERLEEQYENLDQQHQAASLGMWVFLATEVMFFGTLFLSVGVYRFLYPWSSKRPASGSIGSSAASTRWCCC